MLSLAHARTHQARTRPRPISSRISKSIGVPGPQGPGTMLSHSAPEVDARPSGPASKWPARPIQSSAESGVSPPRRRTRCARGTRAVPGRRAAISHWEAGADSAMGTRLPAGSPPRLHRARVCGCGLSCTTATQVCAFFPVKAP